MFLLDINFLIALFDPNHVFHEAAHTWFAANRSQGWATCPITLNGCARILSSPSYPSHTQLPQAQEMLRTLCSAQDHSFWSGGPSLIDQSVFQDGLIRGSKQITDVYLLAVAVQRSGKLVTFDRTISWRAVSAASEDSVVIPTTV